MSSEATPPPMTPEQIAATFLPFNGSICMAINVAWLLYGCFLVQAADYFTRYSHKDVWLKYIVGLLVITGAMHIVFGTLTQWGILIENWGVAQIWSATPWASALGPFTSGLNGFIVQLFFVARIWLLKKDNVGRALSMLVGATALLAFGGSIAVMCSFLVMGKDATAIYKIQAVMRLWSVSTVLCDVLIAAIMIGILAKTKQRTSYRTSKSVLQRLMYQSIETGTVTAVDMVLFLICYETMSTNSAYMVWEFASGPLYGNVLVFVLNSRSRLTRTTDNHGLNELTVTGYSSHSGQAVGTVQNRGAIKVTTDVVSHFDRESDNNQIDHKASAF